MKETKLILDFYLENICTENVLQEDISDFLQKKIPIEYISSLKNSVLNFSREGKLDKVLNLFRFIPKVLSYDNLIQKAEKYKPSFQTDYKKNLSILEDSYGDNIHKSILEPVAAILSLSPLTRNDTIKGFSKNFNNTYSKSFEIGWLEDLQKTGLIEYTIKFVYASLEWFYDVFTQAGISEFVILNICLMLIIYLILNAIKYIKDRKREG